MRAVLILLLGLTLSVSVHAQENKLGNSKLKDKGYERLEGKNPFKVGCSHLIRSDDRHTVYHPTVLKNDAIGLSYSGKWLSVGADNKTLLRGDGSKITVWRNCARIK